MAEATPKTSTHVQWKKPTEAVQDADTLRQEAISAHHDHLITEIETSDGPLATTLRSVYDGAEPKRFAAKLDQRIKNHDREIERMCNYHYQGFIDSIRELQQVSGDAAKLKDELHSVNKELQKSCDPLLAKGDELVKCRKVQKNIISAIEKISLCLPVLEMYGKLQEQMKNKRYYPALKTLEQLEHTYLPRVITHWFSETMAEAIPKLRERIKEASMSELKDFLETIRERSCKIGEIAMKHAAEQNNLDPTIAKKKMKKRRAPPPPNPFTGEVETPPTPTTPQSEDSDEEESAQDVVDFSPVYRCLHIYSVLGDKEKFEYYYRQQRWKQARLSLEPQQNMHENVDAYRRYFQDVVGFFVAEDHILHTSQGLVNRAYMDELWEMAVEKITATLRATASSCQVANVMLEIKKLIVLFCHTLKGYGFSVGRLLELLLEMRDRYCEILSEQWVEVFGDIFRQDNYAPLECADVETYTIVVGQFPYHDPEIEQMSWPRFFPFSKMVPNIFVQVKEYINACLKFSADLHLSHTEIDDMIRKSASKLLNTTLRGCLSRLIQDKLPKFTLILAQLIQVSINMNYLETACTYLEEYISSITGAEKNSLHVAKLSGISMFKDVKSEAEMRVFEKINNKVNESMELASYDWMMAEPRGHPSGYIMDLIAFLQTNFMCFTNLPEKVAKTACMSACQHINAKMTGLVTDPEVKQMTIGALQQFNLDLIQCEQFAASEPVPGSSDGTLQLAFADLRQLLDLFLNWDWSVYLADFGKQQSKYIRVHRHIAISLLEKLNNADKKKNNLFASLKKNERDKKKLVETVLKQLRMLENGTAPQG